MASVFTKAMSAELARKVRDNKAELFPTTREKAYAARSQKAWEELTSELNAQFGSSLTERQVRDKYNNMKKTVKKIVVDETKFVFFA